MDDKTVCTYVQVLGNIMWEYTPRYIAFGFTTVGVALVAIKAARGCMTHIRQKQLRYALGWVCCRDQHACVMLLFIAIIITAIITAGRVFWQQRVSGVPWRWMQMGMSMISRVMKWKIYVQCV